MSETYPLPLNQWRAVREHTRRIEAHRAAMTAELQRLRKPYEARLDELWELAGHRPATPGDRWAVLPNVVPENSASEVQTLLREIHSGLERFHAEHPLEAPHDTPADIVSRLDEALLIQHTVARCTGQPCLAADDARLLKVFNEIHGMACSWLRIAPQLGACLPSDSTHNYQGALDKIRGLFTALSFDPTPVTEAAVEREAGQHFGDPLARTSEMVPAGYVDNRQPARDVGAGPEPFSIADEIRRLGRRGRPTRAALVELLEGRRSVDLLEVAEKVHGDSMTSENTIAKNISWTNKDLEAVGAPFRIAKKGGKVFKEPS